MEANRVAREQRQAALDEFVQTLEELHASATKYPLTISRGQSGRDRCAVTFFAVWGESTPKEHFVAEVEAFTYGTADIPPQVFLIRTDGERDRAVQTGTLPAETATVVAELAINAMAKAMASGLRIIS